MTDRYWLLGAVALLAFQFPAQAQSECYASQSFVRPASSDGYVLAGQYDTPARSGEHPAILMITGSGPHSREQRISDVPMFSMIADHLARRGFVVARSDERGRGGSTGPDDWEATNTQTRIADANLLLDDLMNRPGIDPQRVIVLGHSEGAMIAGELAAVRSDIALSILMGPSALPGDIVEASQAEGNLVRRGASPETAAAVRAEMLKFFRYLNDGGDDGDEFTAIARAFLAAHGLPEDDIEDNFARSLLEGYFASPWARDFVARDPAEAYRQIATPVFALFAGEDQNVPWQTHLPALTAAMAEAGNQEFSAIIVPGQDHFFLEFDGERLEQHRPGEMEVAREYYAALDAELTRRFGPLAVCE